MPSPDHPRESWAVGNAVWTPSRTSLRCPPPHAPMLLGQLPLLPGPRSRVTPFFPCTHLVGRTLPVNLDVSRKDGCGAPLAGLASVHLHSGLSWRIPEEAAAPDPLPWGSADSPFPPGGYPALFLGRQWGCPAAEAEPSSQPHVCPRVGWPGRVRVCPMGPPPVSQHLERRPGPWAVPTQPL